MGTVVRSCNVGAAAGQDGDAASRAQLRDLGYDAAQAGGETGGEANTDIPREVLRSENPTARETIAIADAKLAAELWTSVESLVRAGAPHTRGVLGADREPHDRP